MAFNEFQNGKIYKVFNTQNRILYIGETPRNLKNDRMPEHRRNSFIYNSKFYRAMRNIGPEHFDIELLHNFPCLNERALKLEEERVINEFLDNGFELYNSMINGLHSDESKQIMSLKKLGNLNPNFGLFGDKNPKFNRGCIKYYPTSNSFRFFWRENGKLISKTFSVYKYGTAPMAYRHCIDYQNQIYPLNPIDYLQELPIDILV